MIRLEPVDSDGEKQQFLIYANEPVTVYVSTIPAPNGKTGIHAFVYPGVTAKGDCETESVAVYDGSIGHSENAVYDTRGDDFAGPHDHASDEPDCSVCGINPERPSVRRTGPGDAL